MLNSGAKNNAKHVITVTELLVHAEMDPRGV